MARAKAEAPEEKRGAGMEDRGRKSRGHDHVAGSVPAVEVCAGYSIRRLALSCCLSLLLHTIVMLAIARLGPMDFARPVMAGQIIDVDLKEPETSVAQPDLALENHLKVPQPVTLSSANGEATPDSGLPSDSRQIADEKNDSQLDPVPDNIGSEVSDEIAEQFGTDNSQTISPSADVISQARLTSLPPPIRNAAEFFSSKHEKLCYQITMYGIPVGDALLEATNNSGELRITTRVKSNAAISRVYPVDNATETRMFGGRFIVTTIKRHEGESRTDVGFTLSLGEKNVFWFDRMKKRSSNTSVPTDQVLDMITGFYFLRNQPLEVGKSVTLHLFDNNTYSPVPVLVLRKERVVLPNLRAVDAIVVQPQLTTSGVFNRTGDLFIWLTADDNRVPVKLETSIPLGRVTADLVSSESEMRGIDAWALKRMG